MRLTKDLYLIGNGVIAKALAVALAINSRKVTILRGSADDQPAYSENIQVEMEGITLRANIIISTLSNYTKLDGILLLTNKSVYFTETMLSWKLQKQ